MKKTLFFTLLLPALVYSFAQTGISFSVDMQEPLVNGLFEPSKGDKVLLRGSFSEWKGESYVLTPGEGRHVYTAEFSIPGEPGQEIEYKFAVLKSTGQVCYETRANPDDLPYGNRKLILSEGPGEAPPAVYITNPYRLGMFGKEVLFGAEELQADFLQFRKALEEKHGSLYEYTPVEVLDSLFEAQYRKIDHPMRPHEFFGILTPVTARIGCGHTAVWMPGDFWDMLPGNLFPLRIRIIEGYAVVTGSYTGTEQVPAGSILLEINGTSLQEIVAFMRANNSTDALNQASVASIELRFPMFYARWFGFPKEYRIKYALPGRKTSRETVLQPARIEAVRKVVFANFNHPPLTLEFREEKTALLTIPSFIFYDRVQYFEHFLDSSFSLIREKKAENLILDLRGNTGGDPWCAAPLFSCLEKQPSPYFADAYHHYEKLAEPIPRADNAFSGKLVVLMDGSCFSTCSHFCSLVKYHSLGTIIGTPSAGMYTCNGGGGSVRLVHSRIQLLYSGRAYAVAVENMDKTQPIMPDIKVVETYRDFLQGKDVVMEAAMRMVKN